MVKNLWKERFRAWCQFEPQLALIEKYTKAVAAVHRKERRENGGYATFCTLEAWYGYGRFAWGIKEMLTRVVGWERKKKDELSSEIAYSIVYDYLLDLLPDCTKCPCSS